MGKSKTTTETKATTETKKKAPKAPSTVFPTWESDNTHSESLIAMAAAYSKTGSAHVQATIVRAAALIVKDGEKATKKAATTKERLAKKLAKLAEESKKAGVDIKDLLG